VPPVLGGRALRTTVIFALAGALALTACSRETNPARTVGTTTATMTGQAACPNKAATGWAWQWRQLGTTAWSTSGGVT
jgi:hypothetical protein